MHYQNQETNPKSADNLGNPNDWTLADLRAISRIVESDTRSVKEVIKKMPAIDESIHELEKSLKKSIPPLRVVLIHSGSEKIGT